MSNNQQTVIIRLSTVVMLSAILLIFAVSAVYTNPGSYYNNFTKQNGSTQYSYGEPVVYGKGHGKPIQNVLVAINIDLSDIDNITDAVHAYKFTASTGGVVSHPKALNVNITSVAGGGADDIVFNVKGTAAVAAGDSFTATGISSDSNYKTVSVTDTLTEKKLGNSGKVLLTGEVDLPLEQSAISSTTTAEAFS